MASSNPLTLTSSYQDFYRSTSTTLASAGDDGPPLAEIHIPLDGNTGTATAEVTYGDNTTQESTQPPNGTFLLKQHATKVRGFIALVRLKSANNDGTAYRSVIQQT